MADQELIENAAPSGVYFRLNMSLQEAHIFDFCTDAVFPVVFGPACYDSNSDILRPSDIRSLSIPSPFAVHMSTGKETRGINSSHSPTKPMVELALVGRVHVVQGYPGMLPFMVHVYQEIEQASIAIFPVVLNVHARSLLTCAASVISACQLPPDSVVQKLSTRLHWANAHELSGTRATPSRAWSWRVKRNSLTKDRRIRQSAVLERLDCRCSTCGNACCIPKVTWEKLDHTSVPEEDLVFFHSTPRLEKISLPGEYPLEQVRAFCISQMTCSGLSLLLNLRCDDLCTTLDGDGLLTNHYLGLTSDTSVPSANADYSCDSGRQGACEHVREAARSCLKFAALPALLRACNINCCTIHLAPFRSQVLQMPLPMLAFFIRRHYQQAALRSATSVLAATEALCNIGGWEERVHFIASLWEDVAAALRQECSPWRSDSQSHSMSEHLIAPIALAATQMLVTIIAGET